MDLQLQDKTALVSGSTKGIGFAIAALLAAEGARVIVNGRTDAAVGEATAAILRRAPKARVEGFAGDLAAAAPVEALARRYPAVDILVNNLGIFERKPFADIDDAEWQRFFEINVMSGVRPASRLTKWRRSSSRSTARPRCSNATPRPRKWRAWWPTSAVRCPRPPTVLRCGWMAVWSKPAFERSWPAQAGLPL